MLALFLLVILKQVELFCSTTTGPTCVTDCANLPVPVRSSGNYQSCTTCHAYIQCVSNVLYVTGCAEPINPALFWNDNVGYCDYSSPTCTEPPAAQVLTTAGITPAKTTAKFAVTIVTKAVTSMKSAVTNITKAVTSMKPAVTNITPAVTTVKPVVSTVTSAVTSVKSAVTTVTKAVTSVKPAFTTVTTAVTSVKAAVTFAAVTSVTTAPITYVQTAITTSGAVTSSVNPAAVITSTKPQIITTLITSHTPPITPSMVTTGQPSVTISVITSGSSNIPYVDDSLPVTAYNTSLLLPHSLDCARSCLSDDSCHGYALMRNTQNIFVTCLKYLEPALTLEINSNWTTYFIKSQLFLTI